MDLAHMNVVLKWIYSYVENVFTLWNVVLKLSICMSRLNVGVVIICSNMIILMFCFVVFCVLNVRYLVVFCVLSVYYPFVVYLRVA